MLNYQTYKNNRGKLEGNDFALFLNPVTDFIQSFIEQYIASWDLKTDLEQYGELNKALTYQIDFINDIGGLNVFNGVSDLDIKDISTDNFKYTVSGAKPKKFKGVPLSPIAESLIMKELRKNGYLSRALK